MKKINVLVTGAGGGGIGEQVIKALKNGKNDYFIVATDTRTDTVGIKIADKFHLLPRADDRFYITELINLCVDNRCSIVIPGSEPELNCIAKSISLFEAAGIYVPINSLALIDICSDKMKFQRFLIENGFNICETIISDSDFKFETLNNYPYIIKPVKGSGSKNVFIVQSIQELNYILKYLGEDNSILIQEYVGSGDSEYTVGILSTPDAGFVHSINLKRDLSFGLSIKQSVPNLTKKASLGKNLVVSTGISQGEFVDSELLDITSRKLASILKPSSTINMQCRIHEGKVYIFEINPRFSGTTNLRTLVGFNEPEYLINNHLSIKNKSFNTNSWKGKTVLRGIQEYLIN